MKSEFFQRSPRIKQQLPSGTVEIHRPPSAPLAPSFSIVSVVIPLIMTIVTITLYLYINTSMNRSTNPAYLYFQMISMGMMMVSYTIPFFVYIFNKRNHRRQVQEREQKYREQLQRHREELQSILNEQERILRETDPETIICKIKIEQRDSSLWERSPRDDDFLYLRLGLGELPSSVTVKTPKQEGYEKEPLIEAAQQVAADYEKVPNVPVRLPLYKAKVIGIVGERSAALNTIRTLALQLATHHSPDEVKISSFFSAHEAQQWDWMRWFPHSWDDDSTTRFMAKEKKQARQLLELLYRELSRRKINRSALDRHLPQLPCWVFFLSAPHLVEDEPILPLLLKEAEAVGACTILLADTKDSLPMHCSVIVDVSSDQAKLIETESNHKQDMGGIEQSFVPDQVTLELADQMARGMASIRLKRSSSGEIPKVLTLFEMLGVNKVEELDVSSLWKQNRFPDTLPVPVGVRAGGKKVSLNLHDKIERKGHGPHGLMAGTTGSGKSEVIQSIVASLAVHYHPHELAFLLIDYKGGGMSNTFIDLPHLVGAITNLEGNLIERAKVSLRAELIRRQKIFNDAGNLQHIDEYYLSPWREIHPLPHLVIIIDEFAQLKKDQPEFMNELISIAAIGRTLGVHLILATQKPGGVVDDKIWSNSRFRICLRVQDDTDSREMLKIPDAAWITTPGRGYLQVGSNEEFELVQYAWSGAPYQPDKSLSTQSVNVLEVTLDGKRSRRIVKGNSVKSTSNDLSSKKQLQVLMSYLSEAAIREGIARLPGPWLPPLPEQLCLEEIDQERDYGWDGVKWKPTQHWLEAVVGLVDDLTHQKQQPLRISLEEGHLPVYGMPGTGKTTFLQTMILSLALNYSPKDLHLYVLDFGRMLRDLAKLPHVGSVILDDETDKVKRLFRFLLQELATRRELLANTGAKTLTAYRQATGAEIPAIVVCIDGYLNFRNSFELENNQLEQLLREGGSVGVYFVVTANRITDFFDRVRANFALGVSFELADPSDYYFAVGRPSKPPANMPEGRALVKGSVPPLEFQTALPTKGDDDTQRTNALRDVFRQMDEAWHGERAKEIKPLPDFVYLEELLVRGIDRQASLKVPVGLMVDDLTPFEVDLADGPYFLVTSPMEAGKTSLLLTWLLSLAHHVSPEQLDLYMIDFRPNVNGLSTLRHMPHVKGYASEESQLGAILQELTTQIGNRTLTDNQSAIFLVIDDAELFFKQITDYQLKDQLTNLIRQGRNKQLYVAIAGVPADFPYSSNDWLAEIKGMQTGFLLGSLDSNDLALFKIPNAEINNYPGAGYNKMLPPGQGYFTKRRYLRVKAALPFSHSMTSDKWVESLAERWNTLSQKEAERLEDAATKVLYE